MTLPTARQKRLEARRLLAKGRDPPEETKVEKIAARLSAANTFDALVDEYPVGLRKKLADVTVGKQRWGLKDLICPRLSGWCEELSARRCSTQFGQPALVQDGRRAGSETMRGMDALAARDR
jgi:hypothetical protein